MFFGVCERVYVCIRMTDIGELISFYSDYMHESEDYPLSFTEILTIRVIQNSET